jgi:hypothetical protein
VSQGRTTNAPFWCAIVAQVAGAQIVIWDGRPLYEKLVTGATKVGSPRDYALGLAAIVLMQAGYWFAYRRQPRLRFARHALIGHLLACAGAMSFLFVAALGTVILLDHWEEWSFVLWKACMLVAMMFAFYCYKRQLVGLGESMSDAVTPEGSGRS